MLRSLSSLHLVSENKNEFNAIAITFKYSKTSLSNTYVAGAEIKLAFVVVIIRYTD